jgi:hypothetical protein
MTTVWQVDAGDYSDYRVLGLFSTKAKAEAFREVYQDMSGATDWRRDCHPFECSVSEVTLDELDNGLRPWEVELKRDGSVENCDREGHIWGLGSTSEWQSCRSGNYLEWHALLQVKCWASSRDHAIKVANEIRLQRIADEAHEGKWYHVTIGPKDSSVQADQEPRTHDFTESLRTWQAHDGSGAVWAGPVRGNDPKAAIVRARTLIAEASQ